MLKITFFETQRIHKDGKDIFVKEVECFAIRHDLVYNAGMFLLVFGSGGNFMNVEYSSIKSIESK